ncbi:MAG TPA: glycosyltransferase family A protein [Candidatus Binataceae bacterium]|nr:glycosyltransferase family A protein [Candidatus Binataceae bacterium]
MPTRITVAIPTHNRASTLAETLASLAALEIPRGAELDCLVVDNASSDGTRAAVEAVAETAPIRIRCVVEPRLGSSFARNRAVDETDSDFVFFIDDDAIAEPGWAREMLAELDRRALDVACGMVLPRWAAPPPRWLGARLYVKLAIHDERTIDAAPPGAVETHSNYFSANAGFRRRSFERFGKFREDLGVVGGNPMSGEDTELFQRIIARGGKIGFARRAIVHHLIPPERMTREYLRRKSFAFGVGSAFAGGRSHNGPGKLARNAIRTALAIARGDTERAIYHELECANFFGYWRGRMMIRRGAR